MSGDGDSIGPPQSPTALLLRPLQAEDEQAALSAHAALLREGFSFLLDYDPDMAWNGYLGRLDEIRHGVGLGGGRVPATMLAGEVAGALVGRVSIRHELNSFLTHEGGHIGYAVVPEHRRRGYATEMLRQGLEVARALGVSPVLITCDADNSASLTVIERCGGAFDSVVRSSSARPHRRYWIP